MAEKAHELRGTAAEVAALFGDELPVRDMYGPQGSALYHGFTLGDVGELGEMLKVAGGRPGPVLELACGSGRMTFPFLEAGYEMVGLDSSPHMLGLLRDRLAEAPQYESRLTTVESDMSDFSLDRRFGLILLGTTSVWILSAEQRAALFARVREHLTEEGRFLVTLLEFPHIEEHRKPVENITVFPVRDPVTPSLCTFIEYVDPVDRVRSTSIVTHSVKDGAVAESAIYTSWTNLLPAARLAEEIAASGLTVVALHEVASRHQINRAVGNLQRRRLLFEVAP